MGQRRRSIFASSRVTLVTNEDGLVVLFRNQDCGLSGAFNALIMISLERIVELLLVLTLDVGLAGSTDTVCGKPNLRNKKEIRERSAIGR